MWKCGVWPLQDFFHGCAVTRITHFSQYTLRSSTGCWQKARFNCHAHPKACRGSSSVRVFPFDVSCRYKSLYWQVQQVTLPWVCMEDLQENLLNHREVTPFLVIRNSSTAISTYLSQSAFLYLQITSWFWYLHQKDVSPFLQSFIFPFLVYSNFY